MKNVRLLIIVISLVGAAVFLGDFFINSGHPFYELGGGISFLLLSVVFIIEFVRSHKK